MAGNRMHHQLSRRQFLMTAAAVVGGSLTSACGQLGSRQANNTKATSTVTSGTRILHVWGGVPPENGPAQLVDAFKQHYPQVQVTYVRFVNDDTGNTKLDSALQGGAGIDVYFSYDVPRMSQRIQAGLAMDLTDRVQGDDQLRSWVEATSGIYRHRGKLYSLPTSYESNFFFVNNKLWQQAGLGSVAGWTVQEFVQASEHLSGSGVYGTYAPPDIARIKLGPNYWYKKGGRESNFDHPAFRESWGLHRRMIEENTAFPWTEVLAQNLRAYPQNVFINGQVAMWPVAPWALRYLRDTENYPHDFVTTFLPLPKPTDAKVFYNTGSLNNWIMIHPKTSYPDAAWAFVRFWLTDGAKYMLAGGKVPAVPGVVSDDEVVEGILGPDRSKLFDVESFKRVALDRSLRLVVDTITTASAEIQQIVQGQVDRYLIGEISLDQLVRTVKRQADAAISRAVGKGDS